jgi:hypothetical protein
MIVKETTKIANGVGGGGSDRVGMEEFWRSFVAMMKKKYSSSKKNNTLCSLYRE